MRPKSILLLTLALGCGLVASIGISQVLENRNQPVQANPDMTPVFVALKDIAPHEALTPENVKIEEWPKDKVQPDAITKMADIEGKRCKVRVLAGEQIRAARVIGLGESSGPSETIPKGYRVVAVRVDAVSGSASLIRPGDRVDVLAYMAKNPAHGIDETVTKTILQDISVFAVDTITTDELTKEGKEEKSIAAKTISLLVTPAQAQSVTLATELGSIRLVMRSPDDSSEGELPGKTSVADLDIDKANRKAEEDGFLAKEDKPAPAAAPEPAHNASSDLTALIKGHLPANSPTIAPAPPQPWKMVLMEGSNIREVQLTSDGVQFTDVTPPAPVPQNAPAADDPAFPPLAPPTGPKIDSISPALPPPSEVPTTLPSLTTAEVEAAIEPLPPTNSGETPAAPQPEANTEEPTTNQG